METKILEAEQEFARYQHELQDAASDAARVHDAYEKVQAAQRRVEELYARWAELESLANPQPLAANPQPLVPQSRCALY